MKDYQSIKIPFLDNDHIKEKADLFRIKFWDDSVPVDIEKIIELKLEINIIPIPNMRSLYNTDAFIDSQWRNISVDRECYLDERRQTRLRFSLAHEVGHFILHPYLYEVVDINSTDDFQRFFDEFPNEQYHRLEIQANNFANYLLIPRQVMRYEKEKLLNKVRMEKDLVNIAEATLNQYLARPLAEIFNVSSRAMEMAFYLDSL